MNLELPHMSKMARSEGLKTGAGANLEFAPASQDHLDLSLQALKEKLRRAFAEVL